MSGGAQIMAEVRDLEKRSKSLSDGVVQSASVVGSHIEVEVLLAPSGRTVEADLALAVAGNKGGILRIPSEGDTVQVLIPEGDLNQARVVGWMPTDSSCPLPDWVESGTLYVIAPEGEDVAVVGDEVRLGSQDASEALALASSVEGELDAIKSALDKIATAAGAVNDYQNVGSVGASKVKGE